MTPMGYQEHAAGSISEAKPDEGGTAWVVRAGREGEAEASNLALGRASIGWSEVPDMSAVTSREQLREMVDGLYPAASAQSRAVTTGQLWAFRSSIAVGDLVVMPLKTQPGMIAFGAMHGCLPLRRRCTRGRTALRACPVATRSCLSGDPAAGSSGDGERGHDCLQCHP